MHRRARAIVAAAACAAAVLTSTPQAGALPPIPDLSKQYWFGNYRISDVWALGAQGQGVTVAVLDSGVQADRPELAGAVLPGTDFAGGDGRTDTDQPNGHGTHMAILIAGQGGGPNDLTGIAPRAHILPVRIDDVGVDYVAMQRGITWAVDHGAKVINVSEGANGAGYPNSCPPELAAAVARAVDRGAVVVASSGNTGDAGNPAEYPGSCPGVVTVGAVDGSKHAWPGSERQPYVTVAAPGVHMFAQDLAGRAGYADGTSAATALVSAAIALVWSKYPRLTNRQVVARLLATVTDDASRPGRDDVTGYGIVRPYQAITATVSASAPNPVFDRLSTAPSASTTPSSSGPAGTAPAGSSATAPHPAAAGTGDSSVGLILGVAAGVVVVLAVAVLIGRSRRRRPVGPNA